MCHLLAGSESAVKYTKMLLEDVKNAPKGEGLSVLWMHTLPFLQAPVKELFNYSKNMHIRACDFIADGFREMHSEDPYEAMAEKMVYCIYNGNVNQRIQMAAGTGRGNIVGFPRGSLFSFNFQGLNSNGLPTFDFGLYPSNKGANSEISGADFLDAQYSKSYLIYHGPIEPQYIGGISNTFKYKNWEFSCFVTMQAGNKIRMNPSFDPAFADLNVFSKEYYNRWLNPGDERKTNIPVIPSQDLIRNIGKENIEKAYNTYNYSQNRVADGSFVHMKNISLGYRLPQRFLSHLKIKQMNVKVNVTNPFLIYSDRKLNGQDPEFYRSGGVSLPTPKQYTMTLNVEF